MKSMKSMKRGTLYIEKHGTRRIIVVYDWSASIPFPSLPSVAAGQEFHRPTKRFSSQTYISNPIETLPYLTECPCHWVLHPSRRHVPLKWLFTAWNSWNFGRGKKSRTPSLSKQLHRNTYTKNWNQSRFLLSATTSCQWRGNNAMASSTKLELIWIPIGKGAYSLPRSVWSEGFQFASASWIVGTCTTRTHQKSTYHSSTLGVTRETLHNQRTVPNIWYTVVCGIHVHMCVCVCV